VTPTGATIGWTTNELSDTQVEYGTTIAYGSSTTLDATDVTSHSQLLSGLSAVTLYHYRVKSRDAAGNLTTSADATFTTTQTPDTTPPVITAVQATALTSTGATIGWTTDEASDTQVEYGLTVAYGTSTTLNATDVTTHSQPLSGLTAATVYHYRVKSRDAAGNLATSPDATLTTAPTPDTTPPVITAVQASAGATGASISWTTNETADTQVEYGLTTTYGATTTLDTTQVSTHAQTASGLTASTLYHYRVKSRDAAGNLTTSPDATFTTTPALACPCIFADAATPTVASVTDQTPIEVGVRFRSDVAGSISGVRFYKGAANTGTHVGSLWSNTGTLLATATFAGESATGWQQVTFATPVAVAANITYVASYYVPNGGYAADASQFATAGVDNAPLHALANGVDGTNGVFKYAAASTFPTDTFNATNYWVDVFFSATPDTTPPVITAVQATAITPTGATIGWTTDEVADSQVEYGPTTAYGSTTTLNATDVTTHSQPLSGLTAATLYHYRVKSRDTAGNLTTSPDTTLTTTPPPDTTPPVITAVAPLSGATGVALSADTTATFSEPMASATITAATVTLVAEGNPTPVGAAVTYNATNHEVTLDPTADLTAGTTYTVTIKGGAGGVTDSAGNPVATDHIWTFTT
jgi:hypothetical protein